MINTGPGAIKVGHKTYIVHWDKKAWKTRLPSSAEGTAKDKSMEPIGVTHHPTSQIWISHKQDQQEARATLIHELLHCLFWDCGTDVNDLYVHDVNEDPDTEERIICALEPRLTALLADNPELLVWLHG